MRIASPYRRALAASTAALTAAALCAALMIGATATAQTGDAPKRDIAAYLLDDPEINAAIDKARRTLPRFVSIHQSRREAPEDLEFLALAAVEDGAGGHEYRWLTDVKLTPDAITGVLTEEGAETSSYKQGDTYRAEPDSIADWMVTTASGAVIGGYTLRVVVARGDDETKKLHEGRFLD